MRTLLRTSVALAVVFLAGLVAAANQAKTPLGRWMQPNMGTPLAGEDYDTLMKSLQLVSDKGPPVAKYPKWSAVAKAGADAAAKKDKTGVKASCKNCHDAYKKQYIAEFPTRPFP